VHPRWRDHAFHGDAVGQRDGAMDPVASQAEQIAQSCARYRVPAGAGLELATSDEQGNPGDASSIDVLLRGWYDLPVPNDEICQPLLVVSPCTTPRFHPGDKHIPLTTWTCLPPCGSVAHTATGPTQTAAPWRSFRIAETANSKHRRVTETSRHAAPVTRIFRLSNHNLPLA